MGIAAGDPWTKASLQLRSGLEWMEIAAFNENNDVFARLLEPQAAIEYTIRR